MIFGKYINKYYLKNAPILILGLAALILVDYFQLFIPELYRMVINGMKATLFWSTARRRCLIWNFCWIRSAGP